MIAHHIIFGAYGFWLPNDPRGSWSDFVGSWDLFRCGRATKITATRSVAGVPHNARQRLAAKSALKEAAVRFNPAQINAIAAGFAEYMRRSGLIVYACAILSDHVHLVTANHRLDVDQLVIQLKGAASRALSEARLHPFGDPPRAKPFARGKWDVFLDTSEDVIRAIAYVEANPEKEGLPRQHWPFITPFTA
jgi:REP element-mobilizing transposase RayT